MKNRAFKNNVRLLWTLKNIEKRGKISRLLNGGIFN